MLSNEELLIVLGRQINFDRDQTDGRDRLVGHPAVGCCVTVCGGGELLSEIVTTYLLPNHQSIYLSVYLSVCLSNLSICLTRYICSSFCVNVIEPDQ
jgi:hypothetical protein